nr:hypothetical protein [Tanacetum cinerariifolium]
MGNKKEDQAVGHTMVSKHTSPTWNEDFGYDDEVDEVIFPEAPTTKPMNNHHLYCITAIEFAYWAPNIESTEDKSMTDSLERKDDGGPCLDGGLKHEEPLDVDNCDSVSSKDDNNDSDSSSEMSSTSRLMREVDVRGVDSDHVDSFEEDDTNDSDSSSEMSSTSRLMREVDVRGVDSDHVDSFEECEIIGDSVLNNDGCVKDCMEKNLDDDVEKDIEDCHKNVTEKCGVSLVLRGLIMLVI